MLCSPNLSGTCQLRLLSWERCPGGSRAAGLRCSTQEAIPKCYVKDQRAVFRLLPGWRCCAETRSSRVPCKFGEHCTLCDGEETATDSMLPVRLRSVEPFCAGTIDTLHDSTRNVLEESRNIKRMTRVLRFEPCAFAREPRAMPTRPWTRAAAMIS